MLEIAKCDHHLGQDYLGLYAQDVILNIRIAEISRGTLNLVAGPVYV